MKIHGEVRRDRELHIDDIDRGRMHGDIAKRTKNKGRIEEGLREKRGAMRKKRQQGGKETDRKKKRGGRARRKKR